MALDGMTGIWPDGMGNLADPVASALRIVATPTNGYQFTAGFSLSGVSANSVTGTTMDSRAWGRGGALMRVSGRYASATIQCSFNTDVWVTVSSYYTGTVSGTCDNYIALEQAYPYLRGIVDFVSADGGVSAAVWMAFHRVAS